MLLETLATSDLSTFITAMSSNVTASGLWTELAGIAPFLGAMIIFAFGLRIVRRMVNGVQRGKGKI